MIFTLCEKGPFQAKGQNRKCQYHFAAVAWGRPPPSCGRIKDGWDETKNKASARLELLYNTKAAWEGYASGLENIAVEFEKGEGEITKIKKRFNLAAAQDDLAKRKQIFTDTKNTIEGMFAAIQHNYDVMTMTLPEDKKDFVKKEVKAVHE